MLKFLPVDVVQYLSEVDYKNDVTVDGSTVIWDADKKDIDDIWPKAEEDAVLKLKYRSNGIMESYIWETTDGVVILDIGFSSIPGYELPILLGITAVFTLGLIYAIKKRF